MAEYRDDLGAARMRIETLEAKLAERDAALRAREAEIAERDAEIARLRKAPVIISDPARGRVMALVASAVLVMAGMGAAGFLIAGRASVPPPEPVGGPVIEGKVTPPEPVPPQPPATAGGKARDADEAPQSGGSNLSTALQQALEDTRPKVKSCYAEERKAHPNAEGFLKAIFEVGGDGRISHVRYAALTPYNQPWWSKDLETCVTRALEAIKVPPDGKGAVTGETSYFLMPSVLP